MMAPIDVTGAIAGVVADTTPGTDPTSTDPTATEPPDPRAMGAGVSRRGLLLAISVISAAGLILEVAYTRVVSYKLWYFYTYLVIGLALLGIGSGATAVVLSSRATRCRAACPRPW